MVHIKSLDNGPKIFKAPGSEIRTKGYWHKEMLFFTPLFKGLFCIPRLPSHISYCPPSQSRRLPENLSLPVSE